MGGPNGIVSVDSAVLSLWCQEKRLQEIGVGLRKQRLLILDVRLICGGTRPRVQAIQFILVGRMEGSKDPSRQLIYSERSWLDRMRNAETRSAALREV